MRGKKAFSEATTVLLLILIAIVASIIVYKVFTTTTTNTIPKRSVLYYSVIEAKLAGGYLVVSLQLTADGPTTITLNQAQLYVGNTLVNTQQVTTTDGSTTLNPGDSKVAVIIFNVGNIAIGSRVQLIITYNNPAPQSIAVSINVS